MISVQLASGDLSAAVDAGYELLDPSQCRLPDEVESLVAPPRRRRTGRSFHDGRSPIGGTGIGLRAPLRLIKACWPS